MDARKRSGSYTLHDFFSSSVKSKKKNTEDSEDDQGKEFAIRENFSGPARNITYSTVSAEEN